MVYYRHENGPEQLDLPGRAVGEGGEREYSFFEATHVESP